MGLILLRHPSTDAKGLCYGRTEVPLSAEAPAEILRALETTPPPRRVISSPARRCLELARELAGLHGLPLETDPRLLELDFGAWEGRPWSKIPRHESDPWAEDPLRRAPPGGESFSALSARVTAIARAADGATLVTHAGPIRALRIASGEVDFAAAFAAPVPFATPLACDL